MVRRSGLLALVAATLIASVVLVGVIQPLEIPSGSSSGRIPVGTSSAVSTTLSPGGNFASYMNGPNRTDQGGGAGTFSRADIQNLTLLWHVNYTGRIATQPIEANGVVYFGSWDGYEYAVDATNGTLLWKTFLGVATGDAGCGNTSFGPTSTASYEGSYLLVNGGTPDLYALDTATGAILWNVSFGGTAAEGYYLWSSPLQINGKIYDTIASQCDQPLVPAGVAEISPSTHRILHYFNSSVPYSIGSSIWSTPSINVSSNTIYVTTGNAVGSLVSTYDNSVIALNASTLAVKAAWQIPKSEFIGDGDFGSTPVLFTGANGVPSVAAVDKNGYLYAWSQTTLNLIWSDQISSYQSTVTSVAFGGGRLYAVSPTTTIGGVTYNASIRAINPENGHYIWQVGLPNWYPGYGAPLWFNGMVAVADGPTEYLLNSTNGMILTTVTPNSASIFAPASYSRSTLYVASGERLSAYVIKLGATASATELVPQEYQFHSNGFGGLPPYRYNWSFGDGTYSTSESPVHEYASAGSFDVMLTVTDLSGRSVVVKFTV